MVVIVCLIGTTVNLDGICLQYEHELVFFFIFKGFRACLDFNKMVQNVNGPLSLRFLI